MKHPHFLKSLSLALLVAGCPLHNAVAESHCQLQSSGITENVQEEEKQEKIQMPPHTVHVGAEYSYIISDIYAGGALFLTANREYAMEYLKDGGSIASITLSRSTLDLMERTGALIQLQGTIHNGLETGIEYQIKSKQVIDEIIKRFRYTNVYK